MKAILPYRHTWISQGVNGSYSHKGTNAIDFGWLSAYKDFNLYAPFDGTIVHAEAVSKGSTIAFQSNEKVEWANGDYDYMTVITEHDNNRPNLNTTFKQGEIYSHMGTAGGVAKHSHIEVQKGKFQKSTKLIQQQYGKVYYFPNTVPPYEALYITKDTLIKEVNGSPVYDWKVEDTDMSNLVKIQKDSDYDYKWSVDGNAYGQDYDVTTQGGFSDASLVKEGWELVLKVNGSLFYEYNGAHYACGLEKAFGVNHQDVSMTAVSDYNNCMAVAAIDDELWFASQKWIIDNKLSQAYGAITGMGLIMAGKKVDMHKGFESQWNAISGRTVIGEDKDGNILSYSFAGTTGQSGMTGAQLQTECLNLGFYNAILFDGGGSVFRVYPNANISTTRKVKNALMLYRRKKDSNIVETKTETTDYKALYEEQVKINKNLESNILQLNANVESATNDATKLQDKLNKIKQILEAE